MAIALTEDGTTFPASVTVPEDGDDRNAESVLGPFQSLTDRTRNSHSRLEALDNDPRTWAQHQRFNAAHVAASLGVQGEIVYCDASGAPAPKRRTFFLLPRPQGAWVRYTGFGPALQCEVDHHPYQHQIEVPTGCVITHVSALVQQAVAHTADPLKLQLWRETFPVSPAPGTNLPALAQITSAYTGENLYGGTAPARWLVGLSEITAAVDNLLSLLYLSIQSSDNCASGAKDVLYWIAVTMTDPGPRNPGTVA
jgi:hypothetical protein